VAKQPLCLPFLRAGWCIALGKDEMRLSVFAAHPNSSALIARAANYNVQAATEKERLPSLLIAIAL
jgi:hypothetical protein